VIVVAAFEAPTVVAGFDDVAMMGQAVEQRGCHLGITEHAGPFAEREVGGTVLAFPHIAAKGERLAKGKPALAGKAMRDHGPPEDEHIDPGILPAGRGVLQPAPLPPPFPRARPRARSPGDLVIEARPVRAGASGVVFLDIADLRDGRRRPLLQPSTRHGNPVRTLTLGALRGRLCQNSEPWAPAAAVSKPTF
jgi:hypothetical protein